MALSRQDIEHFVQFNSGAVATHIAYAQLIEAEKQTALLQEMRDHLTRDKADGKEHEENQERQGLR